MPRGYACSPKWSRLRPAHCTGGVLTVQLLFGVLVLGATWAAGTAAGKRRLSPQRTIVQAAEQTKAEERLRIPRDIHDVATHSVGLMAIKAEGAEHVIATRPEGAGEALPVIEDGSHRALRDMRAGHPQGAASARSPAGPRVVRPVLPVRTAETARSTGPEVFSRPA
jgi:hypothetical protein